MTSATDPHAPLTANARQPRTAGLAPTLLRLPDLDHRHVATTFVAPTEQSTDPNTVQARIDSANRQATVSDSVQAALPIEMAPSTGTSSISATPPNNQPYTGQPYAGQPYTGQSPSSEKLTRENAAATPAEPQSNGSSVLEWFGSRSMLVVLLLVISLYAVWGPRSGSPPDPTEMPHLADSETDEALNAVAGDRSTATNSAATSDADLSAMTPESLASIAPPVVGRDWFDRPPMTPGETELKQIPFEPDPPVQTVVDSKPKVDSYSVPKPAMEITPPPLTSEDTNPKPSPATTATATATATADSIDWRSDASRQETFAPPVNTKPTVAAETLFQSKPATSPTISNSLDPAGTEPAKNRPSLSRTPHGVVDWIKFLPGNETASPSPAAAPAQSKLTPQATLSPQTTQSPVEPNFEFALPNPTELMRSSSPTPSPNQTRPSGPEPRVATPTPNPPNFR